MTAKLRIEWVLLRGAEVGSVLAAEVLTVTGGAAVSSGPAPPFAAPAGGVAVEGGYARLIPLAGATDVAWGPNPSATELSSLRLAAGDAPVVVAAGSGWRVSAVEAADAPALAPSGGGAATLADGADVTQGARGDAAWDGAAASATLMGVIKGVWAKVEAVRAAVAAASLPVGAGGSGAAGRVVLAADSPISAATSVTRLVSSAASTNAAVAKGGAGTLKGVQACNTSAAPLYLKLYNLAVAPTVGASAVFKTLALAANSVTTYDFPAGVTFSVGVAYALTANPADSDATAIAAGAVTCLNLDSI